MFFSEIYGIVDYNFYDDASTNKKSKYSYFNTSKTAILNYSSDGYYYTTVSQNNGHVPLASVTEISGDFSFEVETKGYSSLNYAITLHLSATEYLSYNFYSNYIAKYLYPSEQKQGTDLSFNGINYYRRVVINKTGNSVTFTVYNEDTQVCTDTYTLPSNFQNQPLTPCISPYGYDNHRYNEITFRNVKVKSL